MKKRILSMLLALVMILSMVPVQALAEDVTETEETVTVVDETTEAVEETTEALEETTEAVEETTEAIEETTEAVEETTEAVEETTEAVEETTEAVEETTEATEETTEATEAAELAEADAEAPEGVPNVDPDIETNLDSLLPDELTVTAGQSLALSAWNPMKPDTVYGWEFTDPNYGLYARIYNGKLTPDSNRVFSKMMISVRAYNIANKDEVSGSYYIELVPAVKSILLKDEHDQYYLNGETEVNILDGTDERTIIPEILPTAACPDVEWTITGDKHYDLCTESYGDAEHNVLIVGHKGKVGSVVAVATAKDGSGVKAELTIKFVKRAVDIKILNAFTTSEVDEDGYHFMLAGAAKTFVTDVQKDTTLIDREVEWWVTDDTHTESDFGDKNATLDSSVAVISSNGKLTVSKGLSEVKEIQIFARLKSDPTVISNAEVVRLYPMPTAVVIDPLENYNVEITALTLDLKAAVKPDAAMQRVLWSSSNNDIAFFEAKQETKPDPTLTLKAPGKVRITCMAMDGSRKAAYIYINITAPVNELTIERPADSLRSGSSMTLKATTWTIVDKDNLASPDNVKAANQKVRWSIVGEDGLKTNAAVINSSGRVTAKNVRYNTKVYVTACSVEDNTILDTKEITIKPAQVKTFMIAYYDDVLAREEIAEGTVMVNLGSDVDFYGMWYDSDLGDLGDFDYNNADATFTSSRPSVATITEDGHLYGKSSGTATITGRITDADGRLHTVKFNVKVLKKVGFVQISQPAGTSLRSGKSLTLKATAWTDTTMLVKASNQKFYWEAYEVDEDTGDLVKSTAVSISSSGRVSAKNVTKNHEVHIYAKSAENGSHYGYTTLMIRPKLAYQMTILCNDEKRSSVAVDLRQGAVFTVEAYISDAAPDFGADGDSDFDMTSEVVWTSSNKKVIDTTGNNINIVGLGKTTLTATYTKAVDGNKSPTKFTAKINVTVVNQVDKITIRKVVPDQGLFLGRSLSLRAVIENEDGFPATNGRVRWELVDPDQAQFVTLNANTGTVYAKVYTEDPIEIKAVPLDGFGGTCEPIVLKMHKRVGTIQVLVDSDDRTGQTIEVTMSVKGEVLSPFDRNVLDVEGNSYPSDLQTVKWTSSRTSVAKIDEKTGEITLMGKGTTVIRVTSTDGYNKYVTFTLKVN